jgi:hypothetical protein
MLTPYIGAIGVRIACLRQGMIRKSVQRFSGKIMPNQKAKAMRIQPHLIAL